MKPERYQQVEELFHAALERQPEERAAFIEQACEGDEDLRREVESLLPYDDRARSFIETPPANVAAALLAAEPDQSMLGRKLGHYRILSHLGAGGMGEVYLAEDSKLGRKVAIKLLPPESAADEQAKKRLLREAKAAAALDHPNICAIHEVDDQGGHTFIVMQYVEGETLADWIKSKPLELREVLDVAVQIVDALAEAHSQGITHRDIKPQNIMITARKQVKVLDFGLAKLVPERQISTGDAATESLLTGPGMLVGTVPYMSPEQVKGEAIDARSDIFSFGVMLYEVMAGQTPFAGATLSELIAAILRDEPRPLTDYAPDASPELQRIVSRTLRKDRTERYQTATDLLRDLKELKHELEIAATLVRPRESEGEETSERSETTLGVPSAGVSSASGRSLAESGTQNTVRKGIAIAVVAAIIIITAVAGWFYLNRAPVLTERDTILLADFENKTGDDVFDGTLKQGLAIQLQQTPFLSIFPEAQTQQTLLLMGRQPNERVTAEIAREICVRHSLKALIAGSIAPLGGHYVITLEAINGRTGESLARSQVVAESREQVLQALSQATSQLRERLGESLSSIQRFDKPLEEVTTSNLEALKSYSQGQQRALSGGLMEAIPFLKRAVELDPEFARAYSVLSIMHGVTGRPGLAAVYAQKAYDLRDRVSEHEKLRITDYYHNFTTGDLNKRIETLLIAKQMFPPGEPHDLAVSYNQLGQSNQAITEARDAIRVTPGFAAPYREMARALIRLNRFAEAKDDLTQALEQKLEMTGFHTYLYQIAFINGDITGTQEQIDWASGRLDGYEALDWQTGAAAFAGQWRRSAELSRRAIDLAAHGDTREVAARFATEQAMRGAIFGDCRQARANAAQGLSLARGRASLPRAALALALCGEANQARSLVDELIKRYPEDTVLNSIWLPAIRAAMELQLGNAGQAFELLQAASRYEAAAEFWPQFLRGHAYLKLKSGPEAAAEFQRILDHRGETPLSALYPLAHLGLARASALAGNAAGSRKAYQDFLALWKDADAELPILIEAKKEYERLK